MYAKTNRPRAHRTIRRINGKLAIFNVAERDGADDSREVWECFVCYLSPQTFARTVRRLLRRDNGKAGASRSNDAAKLASFVLAAFLLLTLTALTACSNSPQAQRYRATAEAQATAGDSRTAPTPLPQASPATDSSASVASSVDDSETDVLPLVLAVVIVMAGIVTLGYIASRGIESTIKTGGK